MRSWSVRKAVCVWATLVGCTLVLSVAHAHGISEASRETMHEGSTMAFVWLGAEHMVTGYDRCLLVRRPLFPDRVPRRPAVHHGLYAWALHHVARRHAPRHQPNAP